MRLLKFLSFYFIVLIFTFLISGTAIDYLESQNENGLRNGNMIYTVFVITCIILISFGLNRYVFKLAKKAFYTLILLLLAPYLYLLYWWSQNPIRLF